MGWVGGTFSKVVGWLEEAIFVESGRLTLVKSTISNLPTYFMSIRTIPVSVTHRLENVQ